MVAQIQADNLRSAGLLMLIKMRRGDKYLFFRRQDCFAKPRVLAHCRNKRLQRERQEAEEDRGPSSLTVLLKLLVVSRTMDVKNDEEETRGAQMHEWVGWEVAKGS